MTRITFIAIMTFLLFFIAGVEFGKYRSCKFYYDLDYGRCTHAEPFGSDKFTIKKF